MDAQNLFANIISKKSYLCVGLDSDIDKLPSHLQKADDPVFGFNKAIVEQTHDYCVAYKINTAFYEALGAKGWKSLERTAAYIKKHYPEMFLIADAKRGDIGNTARMYARTFFSTLNFDAVTISPYMGGDSIQPFLEFKDKWVIILALTSNQGAFDFQYFFSAEEDQHLFEKVVSLSSTWGSYNNTMYVTGATRAADLKKVRAAVPDHFILVPGVGAQGGSLEEISHEGLNRFCGLLVNASRSVIFADSSDQFAVAAGKKASALQRDMEKHLIKKQLLR